MTALPGPTESPNLRRDAARNRAAVLHAARRVFAEQGLDVAMAEIARQAGVGIATLFRHFSTRDDLITAVFDEKMAAYLDAVETALRDPDPWHGFCGFVEQVCAMQCQDRGFNHVLTMTFPSACAFEAKRSAAIRGFKTLISKAKSTGRLRSDFRHQDLVVFLMANAGVVSSTAEIAPAASARLVSYLIAACDTAHHHTLAPAPNANAVQEAMRRNSSD